jgi:hypothetical protein
MPIRTVQHKAEREEKRIQLSNRDLKAQVRSLQREVRRLEKELAKCQQPSEPEPGEPEQEPTLAEIEAAPTAATMYQCSCGGVMKRVPLPSGTTLMVCTSCKRREKI